MDKLVESQKNRTWSQIEILVSTLFLTSLVPFNKVSAPIPAWKMMCALLVPPTRWHSKIQTKSWVAWERGERFKHKENWPGNIVWWLHNGNQSAERQTMVLIKSWSDCPQELLFQWSTRGQSLNFRLKGEETGLGGPHTRRKQNSSGEREQRRKFLVLSGFNYFLYRGLRRTEGRSRLTGESRTRWMNPGGGGLWASAFWLCNEEAEPKRQF